MINTFLFITGIFILSWMTIIIIGQEIEKIIKIKMAEVIFKESDLEKFININIEKINKNEEEN